LISPSYPPNLRPSVRASLGTVGPTSSVSSSAQVLGFNRDNWSAWKDLQPEDEEDDEDEDEDEDEDDEDEEEDYGDYGDEEGTQVDADGAEGGQVTDNGADI
jgi:hypothetical protein